MLMLHDLIYINLDLIILLNYIASHKYEALLLIEY